MEFYVNFTLNENFEETIKSRFRDDFTYASFSEGEKMRIDLALLFTWRTIAKDEEQHQHKPVDTTMKSLIQLSGRNWNR